MVVRFKYAAALKIPVALPDPAQPVGVVAMPARPARIRTSNALAGAVTPWAPGQRRPPWEGFPSRGAPECGSSGRADTAAPSSRWPHSVFEPVRRARHHRRNHQFGRPRGRRRQLCIGLHRRPGTIDSPASSPPLRHQSHRTQARQRRLLPPPQTAVRTGREGCRCRSSGPPRPLRSIRAAASAAGGPPPAQSNRASGRNLPGVPAPPPRCCIP